MKRMLLVLLFAVAGVVAACGGSTSSPSTVPGVDQPSIDTSSAAPSEESSAAPSDEASPSS
jgi:ABC-type glycerol-3-phosphate transport system substrate-binding protein